MIDLYKVERCDDPEELAWPRRERLPSTRQNKPTLVVPVNQRRILNR